MTWIKSTVFILILAMLAIPAVQKALNIIPAASLEGYFTPSLRPVFTFTGLANGEYQQQMTPHLDRTIGFHNELTRLSNQCDFSFFSVPHAARIIVGKNDILQDEFHIDAYLGKDFIGKKYIDDKVSRLKYLQDYLLTKKGVTLLVILAPGKGCYYPQQIPARLLKCKKGITNDAYYSCQLKKYGVNLIDFNQWFIRIKDTSYNVLYPKTGVHWSSYGAWLCADSLIRYLETRLNRSLPHIVLDSVVREPAARRVDNDMDRVLNLIWRIPVPVMTYPVFHHAYKDSLPKPAALFISDSFYWNWHDNGIIKNTFKQEEMWYYDKDVYPMQLIKPTNTAQIDLDQAISRQDVVILMQTNAGYGNLGNGFVDRAYEYYYPGPTPVKKIIKFFRSNAGMMEILSKKAQEQNLPLEAVVLTDAIYLYNNELKHISKHNEP
ncbi:MAG: hypothetical protein WCK09_06495 [Bacteroidota bacterium]